MFGGAGNDLIVAEIGDGNDAYFGDEGAGGAGTDTLDMSAASTAVTVNLGSGPLANGSASSSQTGNDTLWASRTSPPAPAMTSSSPAPPPT
ncbi:hypothetical protein ACQ5SK_32935 [Bradyrhizobium japonicum]